MSGKRNVVLPFEESRTDDLTPAVRGGKGQSLAEMTQLGLPVPPGFTVATTVTRAMEENGCLPKRVMRQLDRELRALEAKTGKRFGDPTNPLLVSVRSGAAVSMPGMMDTVLNVGMNNAIVSDLAKQYGDWFAWDCYRRFLTTYGTAVCGIDSEVLEQVLEGVKQKKGATKDQDLSVSALKKICRGMKRVIAVQSLAPVPNDPKKQLELALMAVIQSWSSDRACLYRQENDIPDWCGTAINVQEMVFGNKGDESATGVVFSRNTTDGSFGINGEFLVNAQGEDVVAGTRTPLPIEEMETWNPDIYRELQESVTGLEEYANDVVEVEFTVDSGKLHLLQCRVAKRTPEAAAIIAVHNVWDKRWTKEEALDRVDVDAVLASAKDIFDEAAVAAAIKDGKLLATGQIVSSGVATGKAVFSSEKAKKMVEAGESVILIRTNTSPEDLKGMLAASAVITAVGGSTSHAAVVARSIGKPAVVGVPGLSVGTNTANFGGTSFDEESIISVDGSTGNIIEGSIATVPATPKKEVNIFCSWASNSLRGKKRGKSGIDFSYMEESVSVNTMVADFYLADAMADAAKGTPLASKARKLRNDIHHVAAERLLCYLAVAVGGEIRYTPHDPNLEGPECSCASCVSEHANFLKEYRRSIEHDKGFKLLYERAVALGFKSPARNVSRHDSQVMVTDILRDSSKKEQVAFFELAMDIFDLSLPRWNGSVGGYPWARIAEAGYSYLSGQMRQGLEPGISDDTVFADHVFDLQHNNGSVFGKHGMIGGHWGVLKKQLDLKMRASDLQDLSRRLAWCSDGYHFDLSPEVSSLYKEGISRGIW